MSNKKIYSFFATESVLLSDLLNGLRGVATDTNAWIQKLMDGKSIGFTPNRFYDPSDGWRYLNYKVNDLIANTIDTKGLLDSTYMETAFPICTETDVMLSGYTKYSLIGCLNEVMAKANGTAVNLWEEVNTTTIKPKDRYSTIQFYSFRSNLDEFALPVSDMLNLTVPFESLFQALNSMNNSITGLKDRLIYPAGTGDIIRVQAFENNVEINKSLYFTNGTILSSGYKQHINIENFWGIDTMSTDSDKSNLYIRRLSTGNFGDIHFGQDTRAIYHKATFNYFLVDSVFTDIIEAFKPHRLYFNNVIYIETANNVVNVSKHINFTNDFLFNHGDWQMCHLYDTMLLNYSTPGLGQNIHIGSMLGASNYSDFIDLIILSARDIVIQNQDISFSVFDIISNTYYPSTLYYNNDPSNVRITSLADSILSYAKLILDGYVAENFYTTHSYDTFLSINGKYNIGLDGDNFFLYTTGLDNSGLNMYIGTPNYADLNSQILNSIRLFAKHIYITKDIEGTVWDLFDMISSSTYPSHLYYSSDPTQAKAVALVSGLSIIGELVLDSGVSVGTDSRLARLLSWNFVSATNEMRFETNSNLQNLYIGSDKTKLIYTDFIPAIHLRAKSIFIENGNLSLDLFLLSTGTSGLSKGMRAYRNSSGITLYGNMIESVITCNQEDYDDDAIHSTSTGTVTAKIAKIHNTFGSIIVSVSGAGILYLRLYKNSTVIAESSGVFYQAGNVSLSVSASVKMNINDTLQLRALQSSASAGNIQPSTVTRFEVTY